MFFTIVIIVSLVQTSVYASPTLTITVKTNKQSYYPGEAVCICGNLTIDDTPVPDGLVALEVEDSRNNTIIFRTLLTGIPPICEETVEIVEVIPCDEDWNPKESFPIETTAYFNVTLKNTAPVPKNATITINTYDENMVPLGKMLYRFEIDPGPGPQIKFTLDIPEWASIGNATVYANAYTDEPKVGGVPYCPEKSAAFKIIEEGGEGTSTTQATLQTALGTYNTTFRLPHNSINGNYTAYVSSSYQREEATKNITFRVKIPGDADGNGVVYLGDLAILAVAWNTEKGDPNYDPRADFDLNNKIFIGDYVILAANWGRRE